jgi:hypothetical protein
MFEVENGNQNVFLADNYSGLTMRRIVNGEREDRTLIMRRRCRNRGNRRRWRRCRDG